MIHRILATALTLFAASAAFAAGSVSPRFSCAGYICVDADTGKVLAEENADAPCPPASVTKLMTIRVILNAVSSGKLALGDIVTADKDARDMGGTQVYLEPGEKHTVDELLNALMIQSANDAAVALAKHVAGSKEAFVEKMNAEARALGMSGSLFQTPHGLPPSRKKGQTADITTARDLAMLARSLVRDGPALKYASIKTFVFRPGGKPGTKDFLRNHNKLLWSFPGCDGLKTGWTAAGASIATTASRGGKRVIAVVLGGKVPAKDGAPEPKASQTERDKLASWLMERGLAALGAAGSRPTPFAAPVEEPPSVPAGAASVAPPPVPVERNSPAAPPAAKVRRTETGADGRLRFVD